ncbi:hypothetical protein RradSPS_1008 [Rubrobacter radiotolerans]|uniref:DUF924 family protein n=1 Tax=Rubrobacter radiotolerans TaxID=42256 RepID=A0A023X243_RUBRA|nr:DUF924 family protein [Rubrobacter radiotolerans]AHY46291.1 hypothetical protein RradSPS_1008 [Rubrobacter radiotolerans]MDX5893699.1 DUF924 family protein [Rubrobacter radiotolerans]SMC04302.1 Uncharacterized conserved protein, DUF924 family [Rubrobacter radiotolerans DSM 5868]
MDGRVTEVLDFWFGERDAEGYGEFREEWFKKDDAFDREVRRRFADLHAEAASGELDEWSREPESCLALILVLDQFSRNMFRGDPRSFATDDKALDLAKYAVSEGHDRALPPFQRTFIYMPYMHSENLEDQESCIRLFESLGEGFENNTRYAVAHRDIIARFGRFPHRNEVLGRETTPEEAEFLKQPGSSF